MKTENSEQGFTLVETVVAMVILLIGIMGAMSALSYGVFMMQESEQRTRAKEMVRSTMETVFSIRDMMAFDPQIGGMSYNWDRFAVDSGSNNGIFVSGWTPVRVDPGLDGIFGTADDACAAPNACVVGAYSNTSAILQGYERQIQTFDIIESGVVRKRRMDVSVRYFVGTIQRVETQSTIIANLPIN